MLKHMRAMKDKANPGNIGDFIYADRYLAALEWPSDVRPDQNIKPYRWTNCFSANCITSSRCLKGRLPNWGNATGHPSSRA